MPLDRKEYKKAYYLKNKEKLLAQTKVYRLKNKEQIKEKTKAYYIEHKEEIKEQTKEYSKTPSGRKSRRIGNWKSRGVLCDDWDKLYNTYLNTKCCDNCDIELTIDKITTLTTKCLDHDHSITDKPNFRNILCNSCNVKRR